MIELVVPLWLSALLPCLAGIVSLEPLLAAAAHAKGIDARLLLLSIVELFCIATIASCIALLISVCVSRKAAYAAIAVFPIAMFVKLQAPRFARGLTIDDIPFTFVPLLRYKIRGIAELATFEVIAIPLATATACVVLLWLVSNRLESMVRPMNGTTLRTFVRTRIKRAGNRTGVLPHLATVLCPAGIAYAGQLSWSPSWRRHVFVRGCIYSAAVLCAVLVCPFIGWTAVAALALNVAATVGRVRQDSNLTPLILLSNSPGQLASGLLKTHQLNLRPAMPALILFLAFNSPAGFAFLYLDALHHASATNIALWCFLFIAVTAVTAEVWMRATIWMGLSNGLGNTAPTVPSFGHCIIMLALDTTAGFIAFFLVSDAAASFTPSLTGPEHDAIGGMAAAIIHMIVRIGICSAVIPVFRGRVERAIAWNGVPVRIIRGVTV